MLKFEIYKNDLLSYQIIPGFEMDCSLMADFVKSIAGLYKSPYNRLHIGEKSIDIHYTRRVIWEMHISLDSVKFIVHIPSSHERMLLSRLSSVIPGSILKPVDCLIEQSDDWLVKEMKYERSAVYSISTNLNREDHLKHLVKYSTTMHPDDKAIIQVVISPTSQDWKHTINVKKSDKSKADMALEAIDGISEFIEEVVEQVIEGDSQLGKKRKLQPRGKGVEVKVNDKMLSIGLLTQIRIGVFSQSSQRKDDMLLSITSALRAYDASNCLVPSGKPAKINLFYNRAAGFIGGNKLLMSAEEVAKVIQIPSHKLLNTTTNIEFIKTREPDIPEALTKGGIRIGSAAKGLDSSHIFFPVDSIDSLCLARAVIGAMGSGKSSLASNFGKEAFDLNYNVIAIDVADGRMARQIRDSIEPKYKHRIKHIDLGNLDYPIAMVWNESTLGANRMASEFIKFIEIITGELGVRTRRWMKKAFLAVFEDKSATVLDALYMLTDDKYRSKAIPKIKNKEVKSAWMEFNALTDKEQNEILSPVMNRMDYLMDDDNLVKILGSPPRKNDKGENVVDFAKWINQDFRKPYESNVILITIPKSKFGSYALDVLVAFVVNKIWLTLQSRDPNTVLESGVPTFILMDEPHQFMKSAELWKEMVVETRKWRGAMVWFFHTWEQIKSVNPSLAKVMKSAGIHYILFESSKDTWKDLSQEIFPFTINEALAIPKYHAILKVANNPAILLKSMPPIDQRLPVYDNSFITLECSKQYYSKPETKPEKSSKPLNIQPTSVKVIDDPLDRPIITGNKIRL